MKYLYEQDSFCRVFTSTVLSCSGATGKEGYEIELADTAFYPEGGGQPCDLGTLNQLRVSDVRKKEGKVMHLTSAPIPEGTEVEGTLDWQRRFDLMQQHSGEHIVSGMAHRLYGCDNVGFHMGKEFVTIDFNVVLTWEQVEALERQVNQYLWEDHPVVISYPNEEALKSLDYRSKLDLTGDVRIVTFSEGGDCCACCGTHVKTSGQVGLVKLFSCQKFREGVRIELLCGRRALEYLSKTQRENQGVSQLLSAKSLETQEAVERLLEERSKLSATLVEMEKKVIETLLCRGEGNPYLFVENLSKDGFRMLATEMAKVNSGISACFLREEEGFRYALSTLEGDVRPLTQELNQAFSGRGGGKPNLTQGSLAGSQKEIQDFLQEKNHLF